MKLYKINIQHCSQKDSHDSIETFVSAENDEAVYEWLVKDLCECRTDRDEEDGMIDIQDDEYEVIGQETYKEKMIRLHGELYDEGRSFGDAYYGLTFYGWEEIEGDEKETADRIKVLNDIGLLEKG